MNTDHSDVSQGNILVVDDTPANLQLLTGILENHGYTARPVKDGKMALWGARGTIPPDLILLDIVMPDMDGYEVCQQLKADERTRDIPVIFLSTLDDVSDKIKAFSIGGVDYITKPFKEEEVLARVQTHLELKHAREKLKQQNLELIEAARLREDIERITRHDLKTPLSTIISFPDMIIANEELTDQSVRFLKIIEESGYRMLKMINLSLDLFKMEQGIYQVQPVPLDIVPVINKIAAEMHRLMQSRKVSLNIVLQGHPVGDDEQFTVRGEELLCYSMLANVMKNALEASSEGECVTLTLDGEADEGLICLHNTGVVPEGIRDSFFEKYVTSGKGATGTGLGTYSAKLIAETQQGSIGMSTSAHDGTTVTIRLPKAAPEQRKYLSTVKKAPMESAATLEILLVEDNEFNFELAKFVLEKKGHKITGAMNGLEALELMSHSDFDIILMDVQMPKMDGITATEYIRQCESGIIPGGIEHRDVLNKLHKRIAGSHIPVIAMTAQAMDGDREKCLESGMDDYITKPFKPDEVFSVIGRLADLKFKIS
ncbi:MAG: response regulator [Lentisphaerae bacterium]|nr:response regulator [Lentisphaerota bacterium]